MKTLLKNEWLIWLVLVAPFPFMAACWNEFPDQIPVHFDFSGQPNRYEEKALGLLLAPLINIGVYLLLLVVPRIDPSRKNYAMFMDKFNILRVVIHTFMTLLFFAISFYALGYDINIAKVVPYAIAVMFLIFGNYMGNIRQNYFIGIRTPWTLSDETIWVKTHRLAARLWVVSSLVILVVLASLPQLLWMFFVYAGVIVLVPLVYSYALFRKKASHGHSNNTSIH
jgi:uncharacterized membrane protein